MEPFGVRPRHIARRLTSSPLFTLAAIATIAIGIGANVAVFSVIHGVLLKPLPYPEAERLVGVWQIAPGLNIPRLNAAPATYYLYRENGRAFEDIAIWSGGAVTVTGLGEPEQVRTIDVTEGLTRVLQVQPQVGRWFTAKDEVPGAATTVVLTHGYWQNRLGGAPDVLGRRLTVNGRAAEVIGVMPREFSFLGEDFSLIFPQQFDRSRVFIGNFSFQALARLKPGVTMAAANADVARMLGMLTAKFPPARGMSVKMIEEARLQPDVHPLKDDVVGTIGSMLWVIMGTLALVLLIACANVSNLLLVRAEGRQQELAVRSALGASRSQLAAELLAESLSLGLIGGIIGVGVAAGALRVLLNWSATRLPRASEIGLDPVVLTFAFVLSLAAGLLLGLLPVLKYTAPRVASSLREGGRSLSGGRLRARNTLVVAQVAFAVVLLVFSGLMIRTFVKMRQVEPGFNNPEQVLTMRVALPFSTYREPEAAMRAHAEILEQIQRIPGVERVAASSSVTMDGSHSRDPIFVEGRAYREGEIPPIREFKYLTPGTFATAGSRLLAGRDFSWNDLYELRPYVIVSENLAREYWGANVGAAIGKRIRENPRGEWREVIGVAAVEYHDGVDQKPASMVYWPALTKGIWGEAVTVRRTLVYSIRSPRVSSPGFLKEVQTAVWGVNSSLPLANVRTLDQIYRRSMGRTEFALVLLALAGGMALLLGVIGIYGVISYAVSQRRREIGIRMALGAEPASVQGLFLRHGLWMVASGAGLGLALSVAVTRWLESMLFGVSTLDPVTFTVATVALAVSAVVASYVPARRATMVDPTEALRAE